MFKIPKYTYHFLGTPEGSRYTEEMTVQASNLQEAEGKLRRQYGADPKQCRHTGNSAPEGESDSDFSLTIAGIAFFGGIFLLYLLWPILQFVIAIVVILLVFGLPIWGVYKLIKWILK